jgi:hypothetical protein
LLLQLREIADGLGSTQTKIPSLSKQLIFVSASSDEFAHPCRKLCNDNKEISIFVKILEPIKLTYEKNINDISIPADVLILWL